MLDLLKPRKKKSQDRPERETKSKTVSSQRYNDMINYYTNELKFRIAEIDRLKRENELLIRTSIKNAERADLNTEQNKKLSEEVRILQARFRER